MLNVTDEIKQLYKRDGIHKEMRIYFPELDLTFTNTHIVDDTFELTESLQSAGNLEFIGCIATNMSVELANVKVDVKGKRVEVYISIDGNDEIPLFHGIVDSAKKQFYKNHKKIVAYDILYTLSQTDITAWYNERVSTTVADMFDDLMDFLQIEVEPIVWINGHLPAYGGIEKPVDSLSALSLIKSICQINVAFGRINRYGRFEAIYLNVDDSAFDIECYKNMDHEDYVVKPIDNVIIRNSSSDDTSYGEGDNKYIIQNNMFTSDWNTIQLTEAVYNIYTAISNVMYIPFEAETYGLPYIECGDQVVFEDLDLTDLTAVKKVFYVFTRTLSGINGMHDEYSAEGDEGYSEFSSSVSSDVLAVKAQMGDYSLIRFQYRSTKNVIVNSTEKLLFQLDFTSKISNPMFLGEIHVDVMPDTETMSMDAIINGEASVVEYTRHRPVEVSIRYTINNSEIEFYPTETLTAGKHIINLFYGIAALGEKAGSFAVYISATGGTLSIDPYQIYAALYGQGRASNAVEWDGRISVTDNVTSVKINNIGIATKIDDSVYIEFFSDKKPTAISNITPFRVGGIKVAAEITESIETAYIVESATVSPTDISKWIYNPDYVNAGNNAFGLRTIYSYKSREEVVDDGRMVSVMIKNDDKQSVESVVIR